MNFEKQIAKLGIENEVQSIVENCECGVINFAYIDDLSKMKKWEIQEMVGNYLDADLYGSEFCNENRRMKTFCKAFDIEESEISKYYAEAICEWGYSIAYAIDENIVLVLEEREEGNLPSHFKPMHTKDDDEESEEEIVEFKLVSKEDSRIYLNGTFDVASYDEDTCDGDWEYEQNDGSFSSHLPSYWKVNGENLSFEFDQFIDSIDWESFRQHLFDFKDTDKSIDCGDYILHINYGALLHLIIKKDEDFEENFIATLNFNYNEEPVEFEEDILRDLAELLNFNDDRGWLSDINTSSITLTIPKTFSEYIEEDYEGYNEEIIDEWLESFGKMYSQQLVRYAGIRWNYGEGMEEALEDGLASDNEEMFEFTCVIDEDDLIERFLINHNYIEE